MKCSLMWGKLVQVSVSIMTRYSRYLYFLGKQFIFLIQRVHQVKWNNVLQKCVLMILRMKWAQEIKKSKSEYIHKFKKLIESIWRMYCHQNLFVAFLGTTFDKCFLPNVISEYRQLYNYLKPRKTQEKIVNYFSWNSLHILHLY